MKKTVSTVWNLNCFTTGDSYEELQYYLPPWIVKGAHSFDPNIKRALKDGDSQKILETYCLSKSWFRHGDHCISNKNKTISIKVRTSNWSS
jgi:hypothetical protein